MTSDTQNAPFQIRSLIGTAGTGSNGDKLVNALLHIYPVELQNAQLLTPNKTLTDGLELDDVSKVAGDGVDVRDAVVRGGERFSDDAWVTFAGYDESGDTVKGAYPYPDHGSAKSDGLILQTDRLQQSEAARDFLHAQAKADTATAQPSAGPVDPIAQYEDMRWRDVVAYVESNPERAEVIGALESATRPDDERTSVMEAVEKAKASKGEPA